MPSSDDSRPALSPGPVPAHIAIIMDGNGRWAEARGLSRYEGHAEGAVSVRKIVTAARECGVKALTLYAFSLQNWARPDGEISRLMELLFEYLISEERTIMDNGVRLQGIGRLELLPEAVRARLREVERMSEGNTGMVLSLALSYGGREELVDACKAIAAEVKAGRLEPAAIDEALIDAHTYTHALPPLDLMIRTSGELRLSNFLLWQVAYTELVVTEVLWPDFDEAALFSAIEEFRGRTRRFGKTDAQLGDPGAVGEALLCAPGS